MQPTPWHHWPVAIVALVWYVLSAADYLATKLEFAPYLASFTPDQIAYFTSLPLWISAAWAVAAWGGLLGAWMLLRRNNGAAVLLALSFAGALIAAAGLIYMHPPGLAQVMGQMGVWVMLGSVAAAFLFFLYARQMHVRDRQG